MAQFGGGKAPPPWQQRSQTTPQLQPSLLGQHPSAPSQQLVLGAAPQQPQYAPVQQSMIQPPGLGGLQTLGQPTITQQTIGQPSAGGSLMGQPPMTSQALQPPSLVNPTQITNSQMQPQIQPQIQPQVTAVTYPAPRALAPPGAFNPAATPSNMGNNIAPNIQTNIQNSIANTNAAQQPQKQRVFTGTITKLCADFGFVDEDVFFQTSCVKGQAPKVGDRVLVEATYNPNMPFKWNANRVQVIPGPTGTPSQNQSRTGPPAREINSRGGSYNAVPPPNFSSVRLMKQTAIPAESQGANFGPRGTIGPRPRSPRRDRREERSRASRDGERDRSEKDKEEKRENRKRSRSRGRSRSPPRRRLRVVPRYNVQVPKILLHMKEANVLELKKRYSNLYIPSDVFLARPLWSDTFPAHRSFQFPRPVSFHIMNKEVEPVLENDAIYDAPDANHSFAAKVMLMAVPAIEDIFRRSCALSEDPSDIRECFVHPTRLINFLVGLKGKNETMAIGGYWSPSLDGANPDRDPNVLIRTAIRTCKALTGIDLAGCTTWYRFAEIYYRRGESTHKGRSTPARVETTVLFLPDVWNVCPTKLEWDGLHLNYKRQLDKKLSSSAGCQQQPEDQEEEEEDKEDQPKKKDPSHYTTLDPKSMKVVELRSELDARMLNSKGLKSQLIARLTKILKNEQEKEESEKAANAENAEVDEARKKEEEEKRKEEERKRKEEEERKKEEEEKKKAEERERNLLEKRYTLPDQPMIVVHPSRTAKSGKFDCTTMSLSVLLDYRQEDNKEHSFEVSLFAELFNEMLMRDFAFRIYRSLVEAPEKATKEDKKEKDDKKEKEKEKDKREREKKEDKDEKEKREDRDRKEEEEDKDEKMEEDKQGDKKDKRSCEKEDGKDDKKEEEEEEEEMEEDEEEEADDEDSKDETPGMKTGETKEKDERRDSKDGKKKDDKKDRERREKKEKKKMVTVDPFLLLSFVYFDQTHTGYIIDRDLEDIINMLGLNLSRAQQKKLMSKVMSRDVLHYRKMTDVSLDEKDKPRDPPPNIDLEFLAKGNNTMMPVFVDALSTPMDKTLRKGCKNKEESFVSTTLNDSEMKDQSAVGGCTVPVTQGVVKYGGSLVDIGKLIQQLEKSENARSSTEEKLKELQKELMFSKDESKKAYDKCSKLNKEIKSANSSLKTMEEELQKAIEDNNVYQKALNQIKCVIKPLVAGVDLDEEDVSMKDITREEIKLKQEPIENGTVD
ncbi:cell division cycle and apoptosis regulator protein 1-like isoform X1 [Penaeus japonicus]|uniref:cell division cycle and apoptosis regulator protein 1-like isoform X1 n=1 Tax=Penaeus japonicus TaxID=27405 RepID=UPI001C715B36|nr:cell division cycle and apoptosis regulator protein 1-like isoform X1 [Penaeus japonicus]XP_042867875.1 cell division cycle and apoptosis regulator protein 1-like isoform X1 [Penaeus japonicus]XP_042867876.1 cell division cycle and apoptosis regulator protein 1-like isoform X1 [Penaeus japonicus]